MSSPEDLCRVSQFPDPRSLPLPPEGGAAGTEEFPKYEIRGPLGAGGMGEVLRVWDRDLRREIAVKIIRSEIAGTPKHVHSFLAEAQSTGGMEHPGIPPIHDIGITSSGRLYFTMKLVRGRTLAELMLQLEQGSPKAREEYTLHRLVTILERVSETIHFAHESGIIHRDLKPENIMLGEFGEVQVLDWGIAKRTGLEIEEEDDGSIREGGETVAGTVKGTIPYMSPEQARGDINRLDRRCDIYALGCILYEILTFRPAFEGHGIETLRRVMNGEFAPLEEIRASRKVPELLAGLSARAMSMDPADRPTTAASFAGELRAWLDGRAEDQVRKRQAAHLVELGSDSARRYRKLKTELEETRNELALLQDESEPWRPLSEKQELVETRERLEETEIAVALSHADTLKHFEAALLQDEENHEARRALGRLWQERLEVAEMGQDRAAAVYALSMLERYAEGPLADLLAGKGRLDLTCDRSDAEFLIYRQEAQGGILVSSESPLRRRAPMSELSLEIGSYLAVIRAEGHPEVRYPVFLRRNREWCGHIRLLTAREIGSGFVYVPGGPFLAGDGELEERDIESFLIARYPVTFSEYARFLTTLSRAEAETRCPGTPGDGPLMHLADDGWKVIDDLVAEPAREWGRRSFGVGFESQIPVFGVSFDDAVAYCEWRSAVERRTIRLPTEYEHEKAARGVDGRRFPWGSIDDASLGKCRDSRNMPAQPEPVGTFPLAESIYGMADAAGNIWEWTDSLFDDRSGMKVLRGGAWNIAIAALRCGLRGKSDPDTRLGYVGFRCAAELPS